MIQLLLLAGTDAPASDCMYSFGSCLRRSLGRRAGLVLVFWHHPYLMLLAGTPFCVIWGLHFSNVMVWRPFCWSHYDLLANSAAVLATWCESIGDFSGHGS